VLPSPLARLVDAALEATIVPSFSRLGPSVRRRTAGWTELAPGALAGRTVVVTGATSGLGAEIARASAALGAHAVVVGRNPERGAGVVDQIAAAGGTARFEPADLTDLDAVRDLADRLAAPEVAGTDGRLHAIVHNAGALLPSRQVGSSGLEATWATMVVAPHLLTRRLADRVDRAIWMSSGGMYLQALDLDDWGWERRAWDGTRAYAQAKRAQIDLVAEATERGEAPLQVAMHPGWADTPGVDDALPGFAKAMGPLLRSAAEGADTAVWLTAAERTELRAGAFYLDRRPRGTVRWPGTATSPEDRRQLRALVDGQAGTG
jgi:NAD(P)-dependent dehydrogenase (short-subunit alcohol dehydrogenase family)